MKSSRLQVEEELLLAKQSRQEGNEGRARVCSRRAAGAAVQLYMEERGFNPSQENVLLSLDTFRELPDLPERVQTAAGWLLQRVNEEGKLPPEIDLIKEASIIIRFTAGAP